MGSWEENKPIPSVVQKIAKECQEVGCSSWTITRVVQELSMETGASESGMREKALQLLEKLDPKSAKVYASFQRMHVRTSRHTIGHFDRGNIIRSLLKETDVARGVAEKIGHEVEDKIKDLEISQISTALIREMVNVKLLEYGHESIRNQYARCGLPVFDVKEKISKQLWNGPETLSEYNLLRVIPRELGEMHLKSEIFIAELGSFSTKPIALVHNFEAEESMEGTVLGNLRKMNELQELAAWPVNAAGVNTAIAATGERGIKKAVALFIKGLETVFPKRTAIPRSIGIDLFQAEDIDRGLAGKSAGILLKENRRLNALNAGLSIGVETKYNLKLIKEELSGATVLNCKGQKLSSLNGIASSSISCLIGINLPMAAHGNNEQKFFDEITEKIEAAKKLAEIKKGELGKRPYLKGMKTDEMNDAIALYGIFQAAAKITQSNQETEVAKFAEKAVGKIARESKGTILTMLLNKKGISRFAHASHEKQVLENAERMLKESEAIARAMQASVKAENRTEIGRLIEKGFSFIEAQ